MATHPRWARSSLASSLRRKGCFVPPSLGSALYPGVLLVARLLRLGHPPCEHQEENLVSLGLHFFRYKGKLFLAQIVGHFLVLYSWLWVTDKERRDYRAIFINYIISCKETSLVHLVRSLKILVH